MCLPFNPLSTHWLPLSCGRSKPQKPRRGKADSFEESIVTRGLPTSRSRRAMIGGCPASPARCLSESSSNVVSTMTCLSGRLLVNIFVASIPSSRIHSTTSLGPLRAHAPHRCKFGGDLPAGDDLVHDPVLHGALGGKDEVAVGVLDDLLEGLAGVEGDQLLQEPAVARDLLGLDLDVDGLALRTTVRLVEQDAGVGQRVALALGARPARAPPRPMPPDP